MPDNSGFIHTIKPGVPPKFLFLIAGLLWLTGGSMLYLRGFSGLITFQKPLWLIPLGITLGFIFYFAIFSRIPKKHIKRIKNITISRPCAFSFFSFRSYLLMAIMITGGVLLSHSGFISKTILFTFYLTMGTPLILSSLKFFQSFIIEIKSHI
jgi:hypothetical protein